MPAAPPAAVHDAAAANTLQIASEQQSEKAQCPERPRGGVVAPAWRRPHALVVPFPAQGHVGPMMQLSIKLAREGFTITFVNTQHNHVLLKHMEPALQRQGLDIRFAQIRDDRDNGSTSGQDGILEVFKAFFSLRPALEELVAKLLLASPTEAEANGVRVGAGRGPPLTCIISDLYLAFTQDVATKFGIPRMAFCTASAGTLASIMAVHQGHRASPNAGGLINWIPGVPPLTFQELNTLLQPFDRKDFAYNVFWEAYDRLKEATWTAINTFDALEGGSVEALREHHHNVWTVGPLLPPSCVDKEAQMYSTAALWPEEHGCLEWLDQQQESSVLYVSFGSIAVLTPRQFEELAVGLEASGHPLLWVIRADLLHRENTIFPAGYLQRMSQRTCFVSWAPQLRVLSHRAVGGFLTHCGWNSTVESITAGVPMLGWPYFADQMLNKRCFVDAWKVGLELGAGPDGLIAREEVESKVRSLMQLQQQQGHSMGSPTALRAGAAKWKEAARQSVAGPHGSSARNWGELVKALSSSSFSPPHGV